MYGDTCWVSDISSACSSYHWSLCPTPDTSASIAPPQLSGLSYVILQSPFAILSLLAATPLRLCLAQKKFSLFDFFFLASRLRGYPYGRAQLFASVCNVGCSSLDGPRRLALPKQVMAPTANTKLRICAACCLPHPFCGLKLGPGCNPYSTICTTCSFASCPGAPDEKPRATGTLSLSRKTLDVSHNR